MADRPDIQMSVSTINKAGDAGAAPGYTAADGMAGRPFLPG
jgi:hypothetical protein